MFRTMHNTARVLKNADLEQVVAAREARREVRGHASSGRRRARQGRIAQAAMWTAASSAPAW